jgi:hypothetical protein
MNSAHFIILFSFHAVMAPLSNVWQGRRAVFLEGTS